jgi:hypothetical protein
MSILILKRTINATVILALLTTNILSITSGAFHGVMYKLLSHVPYEAFLINSPIKQNEALKTRLEAHRVKVKNVSQRIVKRTARNVTTNISSVVGEAIPYVGVITVIAVTALDVKDGCDTVRDINEMSKSLEIESIDDTENSVCGMKVPTADDIKKTVTEKSSAFGSLLKETLDEIVTK